jgi:hypothetical protein
MDEKEKKKIKVAGVYTVAIVFALFVWHKIWKNLNY